MKINTAKFGLVKLTALIVIMCCFFIGLHDFLANYEQNSCQPADMKKKQHYLKIELEDSLMRRFPKYNLYFYGEGKYARQVEQDKFHLKGIPVLFIPGSSGSYKQVQTLGSIAQRMARNHKFGFNFNFFTLDLNKEMSAFFGPVLMRQTEFVNECINHILSLYNDSLANQPENVLLIGHSLGGMIARALFTLKDFDRSSVRTIITLGTPHKTPLLTVDAYVANFYDHVNEYWNRGGLDEVSVLTTGGGYRDLIVRNGLTDLGQTMSTPKVWMSTDQSCHICCKEIVTAIVRSMFDAVDKKTKQAQLNLETLAYATFLYSIQRVIGHWPVFRVQKLSTDANYRQNAFQYHFEKNAGPLFQNPSYDLMVNLNSSIQWELRNRRSWKYIRPMVPAPRYSVMQISKEIAPKYGFVAITNVANVAWFGACTFRPKETRCQQVGNFARYANMLPPAESNLKVVHLDGDRLDMFTHWVVMIPQSETPVIMMSEMYNSTKRNLVYNVTTLADVLLNFPYKLMSTDVVINSTKSKLLFYNISLHGLEIPMQAYTANIIYKGCTANSSGADSVVVKLHVPWSKEHTYTVIRRGQSGKVSLKLQSARPEGHRGIAQLHLYMMPLCRYRITIGISWPELFGQFVRFYWGYLPAYILVQFLMGLSWQLMMLDEQGMAPKFSASHISWAQPYRVGIVALVIRFILSYSEEDGIGTKLGFPPDDVVVLGKQEIWYPALPILLYLIAYAFVLFFGYVVHLCYVLKAKLAVALFGGCLHSVFAEKLFSRGQYVALVLGISMSALFCGTIGLFTSYAVYAVKTLVSCIKALKGDQKDPKTWTNFNINFSITLLLLISLCLNSAPFIVWIQNLSWDSLVLEDDPSHSNGLLITIAVLILVYTDFPIVNNELLSVMGFMAYICSISLLLYSSVAIYRISYFVNAMLMTIALPVLLISSARARSKRHSQSCDHNGQNIENNEGIEKEKPE